MRSKLKPEVFFFEFATCGGETPDSILVEGLGMFNAIYTGFLPFASVKSFVKQEFQSMFDLPVTQDWEKSFDNCLNAEYALIVAPEDDFLLLNLTKKIEKANLKNLGSSSKAISVTSDKWKLYKKIKRRANVPKTSKKPFDKKFVVKPRVSCGGEGIEFSKNLSIKKGFIAQEYVEGKNISLSFIIGDEINLLSINEQLINNFKYAGAVVPFKIEPKLKKEVVEECINAIECIKGLFGYVGVDVVLSDVPYIIEVNARLTTPCVLFKDVYGINVAELLYKNYYSKVKVDAKATKQLKLVKEKSNNGFVTARGYSLIKIPVIK